MHPLIITAMSIGFIHTLIGPDHYLPFIVMGKARKWSLKKIITITILCGIGHVLGSVILGFLGIALGIAAAKLEIIEGFRGNLAAWMLTAFGLAYAVWGLRVGLRAREHSHSHDHDHKDHHHSHHHLGSHTHLHGDMKSLTPWMLFIVFILGPCEPLIPILMYPAASGSWGLLFAVTMAFSVVTIGTMTAIVWIISRGWVVLNFSKIEPYIHTIAGLIIAITGFAILFLGL